MQMTQKEFRGALDKLPGTLEGKAFSLFVSVGHLRNMMYGSVKITPRIISLLKPYEEESAIDSLIRQKGDERSAIAYLIGCLEVLSPSTIDRIKANKTPSFVEGLR